MKNLLWYGGVVGTTLCMLLSLSKVILFMLGADINTRYAEISDKLPRTKFILEGMLFFTALMFISRFI